MREDLDLGDFDGRCRLFPLPGVVLFPHAVLPLHIFEPRYRQMTEDALAGDRRIAIIQVRPDADWSGPDEPAVEDHACLGRILNHVRLPDGRFNFLLAGLRRIRLVRELPKSRLYRQAEVEVIDDFVDDEACVDSLRRDLIAGVRAVAAESGSLDPDFDRMLGSGLPTGPLTDIIAQSLGLPASVKQNLLGEARVDHRAAALVEILRQRRRAQSAGARPFPPPFSLN